MNKSRVIWRKCLDCCGDSPKEVTFCSIADCSLWPYRFGYSLKDKRFVGRMQNAARSYPGEYQEFIRTLSEFLQNTENASNSTHMDEVLKSNLDALMITLKIRGLFLKEVNMSSCTRQKI